MTNNYHHNVGVESYMRDRYGKPNPRTTLDVAMEEKTLTLGTLRYLISKAENFADDAHIAITPEVVRVIQKSQKPVTTMEHREGGHLHWQVGGLAEVKKNPPRDHLGRFTKRPHYSDVLLD